jgi:hypothetical protein
MDEAATTGMTRLASTAEGRQSQSSSQKHRESRCRGPVPSYQLDDPV